LEVNTPDQPFSGKQSFWERPGILAMIKSSLSNEHEKASFLAASAPHSGYSLLALPITACLLALPITAWGLRLDDEAVFSAVRFAVATNACSVTLSKV